MWYDDEQFKLSIEMLYLSEISDIHSIFKGDNPVQAIPLEKDVLEKSVLASNRHL